MYRLYWHPFTTAMAPHAALEEIGAPHELVKVDVYGEVPPDYRRLHPLGRVPVLEYDGGAVHESAAILMHLADLYPEAKLAPLAGTRERARYYQWLLFLADTIHPAFKVYYFPHRFAPEGASLEATKAKAAANVDELFGVLEDALDPGPNLLGERYTMPDIYLFQFTTWLTSDMTPLASYPRLQAFAKRVGARPAIRRVLEAHGLA